jgi:uncharacterized protein (TIGR03067 family)
VDEERRESRSPLPARPHLEHLKGQAKALLTQLKADAAAKGAEPPKLADAQTAIARQHGFASWVRLVRHVEQLRALEGDWRIARLEVDGNDVPPAMLAMSRILMDGDRFRTESPEGNYEGVFAIDAEASPPHFDIHFVAGPEAGNTSHGIYRIDGPDELTLCLGLVGSSRPTGFATSAGSGHALETLRRVSKARPDHVTGGTPPPAITTPTEPEPLAREDAAAFDVAMTPMLARLQGTWDAVELVADGKPLPAPYLAHASRTMTGNEVKVVVGGQTVVHARVRLDEDATPIAVAYHDLRPKQQGTVTHGTLEWLDDDEVRFTMPAAVSRWRRKR